ncbi:hypothetical protein ACFFNY_07340 [Paenibacillus hodogayensis]|uniref:Uncharacterized protein n=1 Tax=Paenibacillus hodogayensis TaxID=279208 RepID=A0ABV5VSV8_9BACL
MGWLERERELKLDILESLARSQKAMVRIIESTADSKAAGAAAEDGEQLRKDIGAIVRFQQAIADKLIGIRIGEVRFSPPLAPWTNEELRVAALYGRAGGEPH